MPRAFLRGQKEVFIARLYKKLPPVSPWVMYKPLSRAFKTEYYANPQAYRLRDMD